MSYPAPKSDGHAVLAAIRRLVLSDEDDTQGSHGPAPSEPLILTDALRVDTVPPEASRETPPAGADPSAPVGPAQEVSDRRNAGAALHWQDSTQTAADAQGAADTPRDPHRDLSAETAASDLADAVVDEDFLRDIVAEIVREELQGDLGERITRNVRKLVRREIHRAMASRDFDD